MIEVKNLCKTFRIHEKTAGLKGSFQSLFKRQWVEKHALKEVNLTVESGEILGLIGANGAGKTTLMKILAGIIHPTSGDVKVLNYDPWKRDNAYRQQIALLMGQKNQLWWDLTAGDCYLLLKEIYRIPDDRYRKNLEFLVDTLGVGGQMKTQIRRLSLGERMKMEIIAALLHDPKVVFLDEPTIGLDFTAQRAIRDFILHYRDVKQPIIILTSHYMADIEALCRRIVIVQEGQFIYDGPINRIAEQVGSRKQLRFQTKDLQESQKNKICLKLAHRAKILSYSPSELVVEVEPSELSHVASYLLQELPVLDMSISEVDIETVIEQIFRDKSQIVNA